MSKTNESPTKKAIVLIDKLIEEIGTSLEKCDDQSKKTMVCKIAKRFLNEWNNNCGICFDYDCDDASHVTMKLTENNKINIINILLKNGYDEKMSKELENHECYLTEGMQYGMTFLQSVIHKNEIKLAALLVVHKTIFTEHPLSNYWCNSLKYAVEYYNNYEIGKLLLYAGIPYDDIILDKYDSFNEILDEYKKTKQ